MRQQAVAAMFCWIPLLWCVLTCLQLCVLGEGAVASGGSRALMQLARQGDQLAAAGRQAEAVVKYRAALRPGEMQHSEIAAYNLGLALADLRRHREAASAFDHTLRTLQAAPASQQQPERLAAVRKLCTSNS